MILSEFVIFIFQSLKRISKSIKNYGIYDFSKELKSQPLEKKQLPKFPKLSIIPEIKKESPINNLINRFYIESNYTNSGNTNFDKNFFVFNNENIKFGNLSIDLSAQSYYGHICL
jgi:hypothetical protein